MPRPPCRSRRRKPPEEPGRATGERETARNGGDLGAPRRARPRRDRADDPGRASAAASAWSSAACWSPPAPFGSTWRPAEPWPAASRDSSAASRGVARLGRVRRGRLLDLLRARDRRALRARADAVGAARRRRDLHARLALVRRGHGRDPGDGRRGDARPPRVQRPDRVPDRLGAAPRLHDRDRARGPVHAALLRPRGRLAAADAPPVGRGRGRLHHPGDHAAAADPPPRPLPDRDRRRRGRVRHRA